MKSYVTSGTGSQQTLADSQDDKILIYATQADLEQDLANLKDGQIVATNGDEDFITVNEVRKNVFNPVTSNAVAEVMSFSTTEQFTGKYWIDGKPIYRAYYKTANFDPSSKVYKTYRVDSLNIEECINISGFIYRTRTGYKATYPLNFYETSTMFALTKYENSQNRISLITQIDDCTDTYAIIFLEYTRTTD